MASSFKLLLLALLCFTSTFVCVTRAEDNDGPEDRDLAVRVDTNRVEVEARGLATSFETDRIEFQIETKDGDSDMLEAEFKWSVHGAENEGNDTRRQESETETETETETEGEQEQSVEFRFRLTSVVEYIESGTTPGYQSDEDTVLSTYGGNELRRGIAQTSAEWDDFEALPDQTSGTATIKSFQASTKDGVFTVVGYVSTEATLRDSVTLDPNSVKLDLNINDYPFQDTTNSSFLALVARVKAEAEFDEHDDESESESQISLKPSTAVSASGGFGWANTLSVDGATVEVVAAQFKRESSESDGDEYLAVFSFPAHGSVYLWDPKFSVQYSATSGGSANAVSSFLMDIFA